MGLKARLSSYCTKRANNGVNLVTSRKINTRLARPFDIDTLRGLLGSSLDSALSDNARRLVGEISKRFVSMAMLSDVLINTSSSSSSTFDDTAMRSQEMSSGHALTT